MKNKMRYIMPTLEAGADDLAVRELITFAKSANKKPTQTLKECLHLAWKSGHCDNPDSEKRYWYRKMKNQQLLIQCITPLSHEELLKAESAAMDIAQEDYGR